MGIYKHTHISLTVLTFKLLMVNTLHNPYFFNIFFLTETIFFFKKISWNNILTYFSAQANGSNTEATAMAAAGRCSSAVAALRYFAWWCGGPPPGRGYKERERPAGAARQWTGCHDVTAHVSRNMYCSKR
jgi:hypothetical protein